MPTAIVLTLRPATKIIVTHDLSRATHAAILHLIAAGDPALAVRVHDTPRLKPLTVSNILELGERAATLTAVPDHTYTLRVALLSPELEALAVTWTPTSIGAIELGGAIWHVERICTRGAEHPWAGSQSYESLAEPALAHADRAPTRWTLEFASPVTFRQKVLNQPVPLPELVFGSLLTRWNEFAPVQLPDEIRRFAAENLAISQFALHSVAAPTKGGATQIGAVGICTYTAIMREPFWRAGIEILAHFAFYSGVGAATTRGFGRTRLVVGERWSSVARAQQSAEGRSHPA